MADHSADNTFSLNRLADVYKWDEIDDWRLLARHFELFDVGFAFIVVFAPDDWGVRLIREQLPTILPGDEAITRVLFDPAAAPESLAEALLNLPEHSSALRVVWIDSDPASPDQLEHQEQAWKAALSRLNRYRNTLQARFSCTLALALPARWQNMLREAAPDLWSVRSGVFRIEPTGNTLAGTVMLPLEDLSLVLNTLDHDSGDPQETLNEAAKLRGKSGRELLLATLLQRAGAQAFNRSDWPLAEHCLLEAYQLQELAGGNAALCFALAVDLGIVFRELEQFDRAVFYSERALDVSEQYFGAGSHETMQATALLGQLKLISRHFGPARQLLERCLNIAKELYGTEHRAYSAALVRLALFYQETNRLNDAESLLRQALAIAEASSGPNDLLVAECVTLLAQLLEKMGRFDEAEMRSRRALAIAEHLLGAAHSLVGICLNNLAMLLAHMHRLAEAEPLMRRAIDILGRSYGPDHPRTKLAADNYRHLTDAMGSTE